MLVLLRLSSSIHRRRTHSYQFAKITKFFKSTAKKVPLATRPARIFPKASPTSANTVPPATRAATFHQTSFNPSANTVPPATRAVARFGVFFRTSSNSGVGPMLITLSNYGRQAERCILQMQPIENKFSASSIKIHFYRPAPPSNAGAELQENKDRLLCN